MGAARPDGCTDWSQSWVDPVHITTGQGVNIGDAPLTFIAYSIGQQIQLLGPEPPGKTPGSE